MPSATPPVLPLDVWRDVFELIGADARDDSLSFARKSESQASLAACAVVCVAWHDPVVIQLYRAPVVELGKAVSFMFDLLGQRDLLSLVQHLAFVQTVDRFVDVDDALKLIDEHLFGISDCLAMYLDLFPSLTAIDIPFPVTRSQKDIVAPWIGAGWNDSMASMPTRPRVFCRLTWTSSAVLRGPVALPAWWRLLRGWPFRLATFLIFIFSLVAYPYHWHRAQRSGMMPVRSQIMREVVWICGLGSWLAPLSTSGRPSAPRPHINVSEATRNMTLEVAALDP